MRREEVPASWAAQGSTVQSPSAIVVPVVNVEVTDENLSEFSRTFALFSSHRLWMDISPLSEFFQSGGFFIYDFIRRTQKVISF